MLHDDRSRAESFGAEAERYDRARPDYPPELVDLLLSGGAQRVLDVGCGTGIAARMFAARGCDVLGVEPDERMAAVARRHGHAVEVARFEEWQAAGRRFDLVIAAQSWHWVDPVAGAHKAADALDGGGTIALFWNVAAPAAEAHEAFARTYRRLAPSLEHSVVMGDTGDRVAVTAAGLRAEPRFGAPSVEVWRRQATVDRAAWLDVLGTHSNHLALGRDRLAALLSALGDDIDALGGAVTLTYETSLVRAAVH